MNEESISFHKKLGFSVVGRFKGILRKKGKDMYVFWMEEKLYGFDQFFFWDIVP
jgi:L-amino acid N-acyltransferase YncA